MLSTEHLTLRKFREDDFEAVYDYGSYVENLLYMTFGPDTEEDTRDFIKTSMDCDNENPQKKFHFAIIHNESGRLIGSCSLFTTGRATDENPVKATGEGEVGWIIHRDFHHRGYGTEMGAALLDFGFGRLKLHRIFAHCDTENYGSYRVMENIGMRREGIFIEARPANKLSPEKEYSDDFLYAVTYGEWCAQNEMKHYNRLPVNFDGFIDLPELFDGTLRLICYQKTPADLENNRVPAYHFVICVGGEKVGSIVIRIGYTDELYYGGQIGYEIDKDFRGKGYAAGACKLIGKIAAKHGMKNILISNDIKNSASRRVCEKLGARLVRVARLPEWTELYKEGKRFLNIYEWEIEPEKFRG